MIFLPAIVADGDVVAADYSTDLWDDTEQSYGEEANAECREETFESFKGVSKTAAAAFQLWSMTLLRSGCVAVDLCWFFNVQQKRIFICMKLAVNRKKQSVNTQKIIILSDCFQIFSVLLCLARFSFPGSVTAAGNWYGTTISILRFVYAWYAYVPRQSSWILNVFFIHLW